MSKNIDIAEKLKALKDAYLARLPDELKQLALLLAELNSEEGRVPAMEQFNHKLHKLAGSAGSFGLADFGKKAKTLELEVQTWLAGAEPSAGQLQKFSAAVLGLAQLLEPSETKPAPFVSRNIPQNNGSTLIYVLEDEPAIAQEICESLRHFGHEVQHFNNLALAEEEILRRPPNFMICDIMFEAEGRETPAAVAQLQQQLEHPIPVIFISTREDFQAYHDAVKAGAVGYFVKPLDIIRVVDCFEYYLDRQRSAPYRVLIVDDDKDLSEHYKLVLNGAGIRAEVIQDPSHIFDVLSEFYPELILLDLNMPHCSGTDLAQVIRLNEEWLKVPITYLSSEQNVEKRILAMGRAGDDFLTKPLSDRELVAAVSVRAARCRQLSDALDRDSLTGLLKHARIKEQVDSELSRAQRSGEALSLVMLDLDHFKRVNDTYGHSTGDKVLKAIAHLLRQRLRKTDAIGRYGGEEFMVILPRCGAEEAKALIEDVRKHFSNLPFHVGEQVLHVSLSAGITAFVGGERTASELIDIADQALYSAKAQGRNCVVIG